MIYTDTYIDSKACLVRSILIFALQFTDNPSGGQKRSAEGEPGPATRSKAAKKDSESVKSAPDKTDIEDFKAHALPPHVNITHTPSVVDDDSIEVAQVDPGFIGSAALLPSSLSGGKYGWKGSKKVTVELQNSHNGEKEEVEVMLTIDATVLGKKATDEGDKNTGNLHVGKAQEGGDEASVIEATGATAIGHFPSFCETNLSSVMLYCAEIKHGHHRGADGTRRTIPRPPPSWPRRSLNARYPLLEDCGQPFTTLALPPFTMSPSTPPVSPRKVSLAVVHGGYSYNSLKPPSFLQQKSVYNFLRESPTRPRPTNIVDQHLPLGSPLVLTPQRAARHPMHPDAKESVNKLIPYTAIAALEQQYGWRQTGRVRALKDIELWLDPTYVQPEILVLSEENARHVLELEDTELKMYIYTPSDVMSGLAVCGSAASVFVRQGGFLRYKGRFRASFAPNDKAWTSLDNKTKEELIKMTARMEQWPEAEARARCADGRKRILAYCMVFEKYDRSFIDWLDRSTSTVLFRPEQYAAHQEDHTVRMDVAISPVKASFAVGSPRKIC
ncbi:hypothetical protein NM688_g8509 [Phlebia brevispora]|uniref:Uncharacterized protein n=1 Tax=Phlebia brevispora TaxID=194682 RepID=A0ACC1RTY8_9APHY|nr:hypothetical protein NM688_g8509 [Phlebia brevispora]